MHLLFRTKAVIIKRMDKDNRIIGRKSEQHVLKNMCEEEEARLIAVYGRTEIIQKF